MKTISIIQFDTIQVHVEYVGIHPKKNVDWYSCYSPMIDQYFSATIDNMEHKTKAFVKAYNNFMDENPEYK